MPHLLSEPELSERGLSRDELLAELLEGLRRRADLADVWLEPAFDYASRLNRRAESTATSIGEHDVVIQAAGACREIIASLVETGELPSDLDDLLRPLPWLRTLAEDLGSAASCWNGPELLSALDWRFERALCIAEVRADELRREAGFRLARTMRQLESAKLELACLRPLRQRPQARPRERRFTRRRTTRVGARGDPDEPAPPLGRPVAEQHRVKGHAA